MHNKQADLDSALFDAALYKSASLPTAPVDAKVMSHDKLAKAKRYLLVADYAN
jgi:hypothetical protein